MNLRIAIACRWLLVVGLLPGFAGCALDSNTAFDRPTTIDYSKNNGNWFGGSSTKQSFSTSRMDSRSK